MDFISLLITIIGILFLLALFIMSRLFVRRINPLSNDKSIPVFKDSEGNELTSIKADFPASDGSAADKKPTINPSFTDAQTFAPINTDSDTPEQATPPIEPEPETQDAEDSARTSDLQQFVLFIAAAAGKELEGKQVLEVLENNHFRFGDMDIFHYKPENQHGSLFQAANGVNPWTLVPEQLAGQSTPGISLIMRPPLPIPVREAVPLFVQTARNVAEALDADLLSSTQQTFTDREEMLWMNSQQTEQDSASS